MQHGDWRVPDILNANPIFDIPRYFRGDETNTMQPPSGTNNTCVAAEPHLKGYAWKTVQCDVKLHVTLICQHTSTVLKAGAYCVGQTYIVSTWCLIYVRIQNYRISNAQCREVNGQYIAKASPTDPEYSQMLCALFTEMCNLGNSQSVIGMQNVTATSHICMIRKPDLRCPSRSFQCTDLSCIPESKKCNNIKDCSQGEDEDGCEHKSCDLLSVDCQKECIWPVCKCAAEYFQCASGGCVHAGSVCDFEHNCPDASDELYCGELQCTVHQRICADGKMCYDVNKWFDGVEDCFDASDEQLQPEEDCPGYLCTDQSCIPSVWLNDGFPDCPHAEDEEDFMLQKAIGNKEWPCDASDSLPCKGSVRKCYRLELHCVYDSDSLGNIYPCRNAGHLADCESFDCDNMYKCPESYCVSFSRVCDGVTDCQDNSDENNCPMFSCPGMFRCLREQTCIHRQEVCDGQIHCRLSMDDERYCTQALLQGLRKFQSKVLDITMLPGIDFAHTRVVNVPHNGFEILQLKKITHAFAVLALHVDHNTITLIPPQAFAAFPRLLFLHLSHNNIAIIFPSAFESINSLQTLDLSYNQLSGLSNQAFVGLMSIRILDVSYNHLTSVDETFFIRFQLLGSVFHTDAIICCMIPSFTRCEVGNLPHPQCQNLLIQSHLIYAVSGVGIAQLFSNVVSMVVQLNDSKNFLLLSMAIADALFGGYLLTLSISDRHYRGRFCFFFYRWPGSSPCYFSMLSFFLSFQQVLFTLLILSCHTCMLVAFPFKKELHHRIMRVGFMIWPLAALQISATVFTVSFRGIDFIGRNQLCQSPAFPDSVEYAVTMSLFLVYGLCLVAFCAVTIAIVIIIKQSLKAVPGHKKKTNYKTRVLVKSVVLMIVNTLSLPCIMVTEGLMRFGFDVNIKTLLILAVSVVSLSKVCNPWISSFTRIKVMVFGNTRTH